MRQVLGEEQEVLVLALAHGLSVELPLARAAGLLRPVVDAEEIDGLRVILRSAIALDTDSWLTRQRSARAKLGTAEATPARRRTSSCRTTARTRSSTR
jgi:RNA polymerase-interacting CarD/CdnL/TRCF family regulator